MNGVTSAPLSQDSNQWNWNGSEDAISHCKTRRPRWALLETLI